jgi:hypothetical protein
MHARTGRAIGKRYGVAYPEEFVAQLSGRFPGIYVEVKEDVWPRPKLYDVGPFWSFLYALHTFTPSPESEDWMRLDIAAEQFQEKTGIVAAPVLKIVGNPDMYCVDAEGKIVHYDHELNEVKPENRTFWELFDWQVAELKDRKLRKLSGPVENPRLRTCDIRR